MITHPTPLVVPTLALPVSISADKDGAISVNQGDALIVGHDLCASNGVIHGLDSVLGIDGVGNGLDHFGNPDIMQDVESSKDENEWKTKDWYLILFPKEAVKNKGIEESKRYARARKS